MVELLRPCGADFPDGEKDFGAWGPMWNYHFDGTGLWVKGKVERDGVLMGQHGGKDIVCPKGTRLVSPCDGTLIRAGWQDPADPRKGYGLSVMIRLEALNGLIFTGGHFSQLFVTEGQRVARGELLGLSGDTGNTAGAHFHGQLEKDGPYPRNPLNFNWVLP